MSRTSAWKRWPGWLALFLVVVLALVAWAVRSNLPILRRASAELLDSGDPAIRPIGGGTALMLMMKAQLFKPVRLVSLRRLGAPFHGIALSPDNATFRIGAMTTLAALERSAEVKKHLPVVTRTLLTLSNIRVRNVATVPFTTMGLPPARIGSFLTA